MMVIIWWWWWWWWWYLKWWCDFLSGLEHSKTTLIRWWCDVSFMWPRESRCLINIISSLLNKNNISCLPQRLFNDQKSLILLWVGKEKEEFKQFSFSFIHFFILYFHISFALISALIFCILFLQIIYFPDAKCAGLCMITNCAAFLIGYSLHWKLWPLCK